MFEDAEFQLVAPLDRCGAPRQRVDCPVRLVTTASDRCGRLWDLSRSGARVQVDKPPPAGTTAILRWLARERFCTVVWSIEGMCGLAFDDPLDWSVVSESIARMQENRARASIPRIMPGQKRSHVAAAEAESVVPGRCWYLQIDNARQRGPFFAAEAMTTAEQVFFLGSPLAHVLAYEALRHRR